MNKADLIRFFIWNYKFPLFCENDAWHKFIVSGIVHIILSVTIWLNAI